MRSPAPSAAGLWMAAALCMAAAPAEAACPARVEDVAAGLAFLDAGAQDGLRVGDEVQLLRGRRAVGACVVDAAAAHHARCAAPSARAGDHACFTPAPVVVEAAREATAGPGRGAIDDAHQAAAERALAAAAGPTVVDEATPGTAALVPRAEAHLGHGSFVVLGQGGGYHRQSVRGVVRDVPLGFLGTTASFDFTALTYATRPDDARFRAGQRAQLYVHETMIARRVDGERLVLAIGRVRPRAAPGLAYLDGAQVGLRVTEALEIGVLGGGLPDVVALGPTVNRWTAGAYGRWRAATGAWQVALSGRAGVVDSDETGPRGELEVEGRVGWGRRLSVAAAARVVGDGDGAALPSARAHVSADLGHHLRLSVDGRLRASGPDPFAPGLPVVGADHGRASLTWSGLEGLTLGVVGHVGHLRDDDLTRGGLGPEVGLPALFGALGGLWLGYQEAFGWLPGRTGWAQTRLRPVDRLTLWTRVGYSEDRGEAGALRDLGGFVQADWRATPWLDVRGTVFGRVGLVALDASPRGGLTARVSLVGRF